MQACISAYKHAGLCAHVSVFKRAHLHLQCVQSFFCIWPAATQPGQKQDAQPSKMESSSMKCHIGVAKLWTSKPAHETLSRKR